ncbi:MAG: F0F1 ATP synthase subunit A [Candidatus Paceibacterota bacterium]|jgi:F-type H+-transporting ATPase subunit a
MTSTTENTSNQNSLVVNAVEPSQEIVHETTIYAEPVAHVRGFDITNSLLTSWLAVLVIIAFSLTIRRSLKTVPKGIQNIFEVLVEGALDLCDQVTSDRKISEKVFPIAFSIFIFILVNNWLGIIPGIGSIGQIVVEHGENVFVPYFRAGTADINTTLALSFMTVVGANIFGILSLGVWKTINKYVNMKILGDMFTKVRRDPKILIVAPITFFVSILELIGECAKIASLSFRLFGNVFAGEVLLAAMGAISAFILPIPFLALEIFVGLIQAFIFSLLVIVYFTIASTDHDHEEEHGEAHLKHA